MKGNSTKKGIPCDDCPASLQTEFASSVHRKRIASIAKSWNCWHSPRLFNSLYQECSISGR